MQIGSILLLVLQVGILVFLEEAPESALKAWNMLHCMHGYILVQNMETVST